MGNHKHLISCLMLWSTMIMASGWLFGEGANGKKSNASKCKATKFRALEDALLTDADWLDWQAYTARYTGNVDFFNVPVIATEVSQVPCKAKGCCNLVVHLRPNSTDWAVFQEVFVEGGFDPVLALLNNPKSIIDGGAYAGFTSTLLALLYPSAQIIMVEPDAQNFMVAKLNTHRFKNVMAVNAGLWSKTACISMVHKQGEWGNVFQESAAKGGKCQSGLKAVGIAQILKHFGMKTIDYVKIDIEGAEFKVFDQDSDLSWLKGTKLISIETHDRLAHLFGLHSVSDIVAQTLGQNGFEQFKHHELEFWHPIGAKLNVKAAVQAADGVVSKKKATQKLKSIEKKFKAKTEMQLEDEADEVEESRR